MWAGGRRSAFARKSCGAGGRGGTRNAEKREFRLAKERGKGTVVERGKGTAEGRGKNSESRLIKGRRKFRKRGMIREEG